MNKICIIMVFILKTLVSFLRISLVRDDEQNPLDSVEIGVENNIFHFVLCDIALICCLNSYTIYLASLNYLAG